MSSKSSLKKNTKHLLLTIVIIVLVIAIVLLKSKPREEPEDGRMCFMEPKIPQKDIVSNGYTRLGDVLTAQPKPYAGGRNIFFIETSCHRLPTINLASLSARQACSIESAARNNPNSTVFVLYASPTYQHKDQPKPYLNALLSYGNVHLRTMDLWKLSANTLVAKFIEDGALFKSIYLREHVSDFIRGLVLWHWGGTYLDTDIVVLRSMEQLEPNYLGGETSDFIASCILNFSHDGFGHEFITEYLRHFAKGFDGTIWGHNGPILLTHLLKKICNVDAFDELFNKPKLCKGLQLFPPELFFPIHHPSWKLYFEEKNVTETMKLLEKAYSVHLWNRLSKVGHFPIGTQVPYGILAERHCPKVYAEAGQF